ncbi:maleylacetoacetate isomerase [uncultured Endozoicomonas sp.]|uniref:maleylacetoacetate isomerase n=1 Tax=uncultured Endozoicomonas sp. TaxID=432652 RepID=UPI002625E3E3|nr:maleylacetoacetate isomerase [uncultured Endozoicomonas sp.]
MGQINLYSYFRSSAAYRVRIALNLKGLDYQQHAINLLKGEQKSKEYRSVNPQGLVPTMMTEHGSISQSLAMLEWLEETYPEPSIIPGDSYQKAQLRSMAYQICCDIHPLNNLRVLNYLKNEFSVSEEEKSKWYQHWITIGFKALEAQLDDHIFCCSDHPSIVDISLIPQVYNAMRFNLNISDFPKIQTIYQHCNTMSAFMHAAPENQPDT